MGFETYPKSSKEPTRVVGEQESTNWPESSSTHYPGGGVKGTSYDGDKSKTLHCSGGDTTPPGKTYPKKAPPKFGTEAHDGI